MGDLTDWKCELEEIFRTHENRIENELKKMSQSFEKCTPAEDMNFMTNFFDYLSCRLVATCKKIEVDYFAKKTEHHRGNIGASPNRKIVEISPHKNNLEELHGQWEKEKLKIVEDYDSTDLSSNDSSNILPDFSESSTDNLELAKCMGLKATNVYSLHNKPEPKNNNKIAHSLDLSTKRANDLKIDNEMNKKYKPDSKSKWDSEEEGDIVESKVPRNIDKSIYATNSDYNRKCVLCEKTSAEIISHYKNRHENDEVFISRPSPLMADKIRYQFDNFTSSTSKGLFKISGICYFCEQTHQMIMFDWKNHVLYHTGEMEFARSSFGHYSNKPIESELVGFMCRSCNYLQVNEDNLKKHMKNEHELSSNIENGYEKVTLLPDLRPVQIIKTNIELIEELDQYTCGIGWCDHKSKNILAFKAHLLESHDDMDENTRFGCLHCGKILTYNGKLFSGDMIEHLNLHGKHFYACLFCDVAHSTDMDMMLHLIQKHPMEKIKFHHLYRTDYLNSHTSEELTINLTCKECTNEFANITDAINHIQYQHGHRNIDLGTSKLSKRTSNGLTKISHSKNSMNVCQYYKCYICDEFRYNEYSLLKHFTNSHRQHSLILKPGEIYLTSSDNVINVNNSINNVFYCYHCYEMDCRYVGYVDCQDVFSHWSTTHCSKSFRFFYAEIIKCAHCNVIGTYQALKFHASREHANQQFATLKLSGRDECSLCQFAGENFDEHFQNEHYSIENVDIFCPIPLNDDKLNQLIKLKGQKKRRCQHCNYVFESRNDIESHHLIKHPQLKLSTQKFYDNESIHFITSCCQLKIASNDLFIHLKQHEFLTHCTDCSFKAKDFSEFENHHIDYHGDKYDPKQKYSEKLMDIFWRTKVVYGNGLVLNKHNLIGTKHDDSLIFATFIQDILREKKISFKA